jgi:hypothetical protein
MRKIEEEMITAIKEAKSYRKNNTEIKALEVVGKIYIYLHDNLVASITPNICLRIMDAGHRTTTTKSRLNAILYLYNVCKIYSKNYQWYLNEEEWAGCKTFKLKKMTNMRDGNFNPVIIKEYLDCQYEIYLDAERDCLSGEILGFDGWYDSDSLTHIKE